MTKVGIIHPGNMGVSVAASAADGGHEVYWASEGRSPQTRQRAERVGLSDVGTLEALCQVCDVLLSVCPPHAAEDVADHVLSAGFTGLYLDGNAISPQRVVGMAGKMSGSGVDFVDGGIVGGPAWEPGQTWLYLSGERAEQIAQLFAGGPLETAVIGHHAGKASALKMCYAAWTKGSTALRCAVVASAAHLDVWEELAAQWDRDWPGFSEETVGRVRRVTAKAWRFAGEMEEIAATFEKAGLPGDFGRGAASVYRRLGGFKGASETPGLEQVLAALVAAEIEGQP